MIRRTFPENTPRFKLQLKKTSYDFTKMEADPGFIAAVEEARQGQAEGGVPIGACLVSKDGKILGRGHNMRVQKGSATLHVS